MSGGSFDYLYYKLNANDANYFLDNLEGIELICNMINELKQYGKAGVDGANEAWNDLQMYCVLIQDLGKKVNDLNDVFERLSNVMKAVEWHQSSDWGIDQVKEALKEYKAEER